MALPADLPANIQIVWITDTGFAKGPAGLSSDLASNRYRVFTPARWLTRLGHPVLIAGAAPPRDIARLSAAGLRTAVVAKNHSDTRWRNRDLVRVLKAAGVRIVLDLSDNHLTRGEFRPYYAEMAALSDLITVASPRLGEIAAQATGRPVTVIEDAFEGPAGAPAFDPGHRPIRLLWFGAGTSAHTLAPWADTIVAQPDLHLHLVTAPEVIALVERKGVSLANARFTPWSLDTTWAALAACDLVILPTLATDKQVAKGHNRLVESLRAGRFAICGPLPAYEELADFAWVGTDLMAGIRWALDHPEEVRRRIAAGQALIADRFSPATIGGKWAQALGVGGDG